MSRSASLSALSLFAAVGTAPAQSFALSAPVATGVNLQLPGTAQTAQIPAGALNATGSTVFNWQNSSAAFEWSSLVTATSCSLDVRAVCRLAAAGTASVSPGELLFTLSLPPGFIELEFEFIHYATARAPTPIMRIDVGADGVPELTEATPLQHQSTGRPIGAAPLPILVRVDAALTLPGTVYAQLRVTVRPLDRVRVLRAFEGCANEPFSVAATWSGGIEYRGYPGLSPMVAVFGLQSQPVVLPPHASLPCILFPTPDAIVLVPTSAPQTLAIPVALRPLDFWVQGVTVDWWGFTMTAAYHVDAL